MLWVIKHKREEFRRPELSFAKEREKKKKELMRTWHIVHFFRTIFSVQVGLNSPVQLGLMPYIQEKIWILINHDCTLRQILVSLVWWTSLFSLSSTQRFSIDLHLTWFLIKQGVPSPWCHRHDHTGTHVVLRMAIDQSFSRSPAASPSSLW